MSRLIQHESGAFWTIAGDSHIGKWSIATRKLCHDDYTLGEVRGLVPEGGIVFDGGAYIGDHTFAYGEWVGPKGRVIAVEPNREAFDALTKNCEGQPWVVCHNLALDDEDMRRVDLFGDGGNYGATFARHGKDGAVLTATIDSLCYGLERLDYLKLDIEGFETRALAGGTMTIGRFHPAMLIEVNAGALGMAGSSPSQLLGFIGELGYSWRSLGPDPMSSDQTDIICTKR